MEKKHEPKNIRNRADWEKAVAINTDPYGGAAIAAAAHTMCLLDEGKTCEEAENSGFHGKDLTGFLAGQAASLVSHCHERGDDFRDYWNGKWGVGPGEKGIVNPAIVTINPDKIA